MGLWEKLDGKFVIGINYSYHRLRTAKRMIGSLQATDTIREQAQKKAREFEESLK